jgi:chaperonin cofactor prefoldin
MFGVDHGDLDDEEVMDMARDFHEDLMDELEGAEMGDYEDDDEDEEDEDMEMEGDDMDAMMDRVQNLASRLEDVEDAVAQAMTADDVDAELEDAAGNKLADAETVKQLEEAKEDIDRRLQRLEDKGEDPKTLTDTDDDFEPTYDTVPSSTSNW